MHGLILFAGPVKKTFWILVTLLTLVGFGINAFSLIGRYTNGEVVVVVDIKHEKELPFPAVTGWLIMQDFAYNKNNSLGKIFCSQVIDLINNRSRRDASGTNI